MEGPNGEGVFPREREGARGPIRPVLTVSRVLRPARTPVTQEEEGEPGTVSDPYALVTDPAARLAVATIRDSLGVAAGRLHAEVLAKAGPHPPQPSAVAVLALDEGLHEQM